MTLLTSAGWLAKSDKPDDNQVSRYDGSPRTSRRYALRAASTSSDRRRGGKGPARDLGGAWVKTVQRDMGSGEEDICETEK